MEPPSLEEMVGATIEPMIETTGNQVDMDVFLNPPEPETELRHRTNVQSVSSGKIKLSLTYEKVSKIFTTVPHIRSESKKMLHTLL